MFWKKTSPSPAIFSYETDDQRASFRVHPSVKAPVTLFFSHDKSTVEVLDIGEGGLAFQNDSFKAGDMQQALFAIPTENVMISTTIEILRVDENNVCHCKFRDLASDAQNAIRRYMLVIQKAELRKKKAMVIPPRPEL